MREFCRREEVAETSLHPGGGPLQGVTDGRLRREVDQSEATEPIEPLTHLNVGHDFAPSRRRAE